MKKILNRLFRYNFYIITSEFIYIQNDMRMVDHKS